MIESIKMLERRFNFFPAKFSWRGQIHQIDAVNECKTVTHPWEDRTTYHYWVRCNDTMMHLCEVLPSGQWQVHQ